MKLKKHLAIFLLLLLCLPSIAQIKSKLITISFSDVTLSEAITRIEKVSGYTFFYDANQVDVSRKVSLKADNLSIDKVMDALLRNSKLKFEVTNTQIALFPVGQKVQEQPRPKRKTGIVTDAGGEPIIGANVTVKGTANGTITDLNGHFSLEVSDRDLLVISFIGYTTREVKTAGKPSFSIILKEDAQTLDEVLVTAYGGRQLRSKVTNSISKVKEDVLTTGLHANPAQALSGAVSGLRVQQTSGNPGDVPTMVLRGGTNLDGTGSPLIVVDGQVREDLGDINPEDIQSMEVMKDAGATAIYGARANNGVILVTTKRGREGHSEIRFKAKVGLNYFQDTWNFLNGEDYLYYQRLAWQRAGQVFQLSDGSWLGTASMANLKNAQPYGTGNIYFNSDGSVADGNKVSNANWSPMIYADNLAFLLDKGWKTMIDPVYGDKIIYKEFNLRDTNIKDCAITQDYNMSISGGNEKGNYYASFGYNDSEGNAIGNYYKRFSFTLNADYKIRKWLTSQSTLSFVDSKGYGVYQSSVKEEQDIANYFSRVLSVPPTFRGVNEDGEYLIGVRGLEDSNYLINWKQRIRDNNRNRLNISQAFVIDLWKGLNLKVTGSWYVNEFKKEAFNKNLITGVNVVDTKHESYDNYDRYLNQTYNAVLNYERQLFKDHFVSAMAGFEYYESYRKGFDAYGYGAPTDDFQDLNLTQQEGRTMDSWHEKERIMSFFGRLNYDFRNKYLLSFVIRRDGYSKLLGSNRWGVFPGVSAGWVFSKEKFMQPLQEVISFAKLRASYGLNGNVSGIGPYDLQGGYSGYSYGGYNGFLLNYTYNKETARYDITGLANSNLRWEKSSTFEIGLDLSFLANKYNLNLTYYNRHTTDKFADIKLPSHSGLYSFKTNNGEIQNQGMELDFNTRIIDAEDWKFNVNWNIAYNKNKIVSLPNNGTPLNRQESFEVYSGNGNEKIWVGGYQEGQSWGDVYAYKAEGIYKSQNEIPGNLIDKSVGNNGSNNKFLYGPDAWERLTDEQKKGALPIQPGDVKWKDVNGDGVIDQYDQVKIGNRVPKWTGGINLILSWKEFTLSARMDYALGHIVTDTRTPWMLGDMQGAYNSVDLVKDTWSEENADARYPVYTRADQLGKRNYARTTSMFMYKGDYLAFRDVTLLYKLPAPWLKKVFIQSAELSVTAQNLGYLWAGSKTMFSPEYGADSQGGYSLPRSVIVGLNVSF